ncbi:hypothetical protein LCGC14_2557470 [marine sediment metagenome]|uniref:Uncharacterized protein n=1 Tax=marine sediment metagenome TaxID=412755 RepID=A0A0F9AL16_9ZZZZ
MTEEVRVLRILEYKGTREFVTKSLENRGVKEIMKVPNGQISEAFLGGILGFEVISDLITEKEDGS